MSNEITPQGFILKQQPLGEADILLTFFAKEEGKIRVLVKSAKRLTNKLSGRLQPAALVLLTITGRSSMKQVIGAEILESYAGIIEDQSKINALLTMQELTVRALADEQTNLALFDLYKKTLTELNSNQTVTPLQLLVRFYFQALSVLGFQPKFFDGGVLPNEVFFNFAEGRFEVEAPPVTGRVISLEAYRVLQNLLNSSQSQASDSVYIELVELLSDFASFMLERELKAKKLMLS